MARLLDHVDTKLGYELTGDGPKNHSKCIRTQQSTHVGEVLNTWYNVAVNVAVQVRSINLWCFLILTLWKAIISRYFSKINHHHHISQSYHDGNANREACKRFQHRLTCLFTFSHGGVSLFQHVFILFRLKLRWQKALKIFNRPGYLI